MVSKTKINITVFTSGFVLMVFEIIGSRILAPFLGSSSIVWTSIIGVILGFMSLGYWYGGKMADKQHSLKALSLVILGAALSIWAMNLGKNVVLKSISFLEIHLIFRSVINATILFSIPSFLMAMVTPFALRLSIKDAENAGEISGSIFAVSTIGSIAGTFTGGFVLISLFGTNHTLLILGAVLFLLAIYVYTDTIKQMGVLGLLLFVFNFYYINKDRDFLDFDTQYSRVFITTQEYQNQASQFLLIDGFVNSGMYLSEPNKLVFEYTQFYDVFEHFKPDFNTTVMFGGAGYSYPKHFQEKHPNKSLDIVEIDPQLTQLAKEYFEFNQTPNTTVIHQDAKLFLNQTQTKYDVVLYDVLTSNLSVPFYLTTQETFTSIKNIMNTDAVLIMNLLGNLDGEGANFLKSEYLTLKTVFEEVSVFSAQDTASEGMKNYMFVALTQKSENLKETKTNYLQNPIKLSGLENAMILTDDFAPTNYLMSIR
jgi:spermidine synthase